MSTISGKNPDGSDWIQYTSQGPIYRGRFQYGRGNGENYFRVWRDDQSRAFECGSFGEVQSVVMAWTMEAWKRPRYDVVVGEFDKAEYIVSYWSREAAEDAKLEALRPTDRLIWATIREVPWEEYSKK